MTPNNDDRDQCEGVGAVAWAFAAMCLCALAFLAAVAAWGPQ